jgi:hypothetical protein
MTIFNIKSEDTIISKTFSLNSLSFDQSFDSEVSSDTQEKGKKPKRVSRKLLFLENLENKAKLHTLPNNDCVTMNVQEMKNKYIDSIVVKPNANIRAKGEEYVGYVENYLKPVL